MIRKSGLCILLCVFCMWLFGQAVAEAPIRLLALNVGKADALLLDVGGEVFLIDAGTSSASGRIRYGMEYLGAKQLAGVIVTHTDADHVGSLEWLAESGIPVGKWYASAFYTDVKTSKHPVMRAADLCGATVSWLKAGDQLQLDQASIDVLAPGRQSDTKDNNNSLVLMVSTAYGNMLLTGDMEFEEEAWLLKQGVSLKCDVLKVANHADDDTGSAAFLRAAHPEIAVISTSTAEKPETPDHGLMLRLGAVGAKIYQTQDTGAGVLIELTENGSQVTALDVPTVSAQVCLAAVDRNQDTVTLLNTGSEEVNLSGWYLISDRGNESYVIPDGTVLAPGKSLVIGTRSTSRVCDLTWPDKKVIHAKKTDVLTLYQPNGAAVSQMGNGI